MEYYSLERILKCRATFNILLGQRANGKSYQVKQECVKEAFLGMGDLIYLRRWSLETKNDDVTDYFADCPVKDITGGQYDCITVYRSRIYLANNNDGEIKRGKCIGRTAALTAAPHLKSVIERGKYRNILYEEFCTDGGYLPNEPNCGGAHGGLGPAVLEGQDWAEWATDGLLDEIIPMNYHTNHESFVAHLQAHLRLMAGTPVKFTSGVARESSMGLLPPSEFRRRFEAMSAAGVQGAFIFNKTNIYSDDYLSVIREYANER